MMKTVGEPGRPLSAPDVAYILVHEAGKMAAGLSSARLLEVTSCMITFVVTLDFLFLAVSTHVHLPQGRRRRAPMKL